MSEAYYPPEVIFRSRLCSGGDFTIVVKGNDCQIVDISPEEKTKKILVYQSNSSSEYFGASQCYIDPYVAFAHELQYMQNGYLCCDVIDGRVYNCNLKQTHEGDGLISIVYFVGTQEGAIVAADSRCTTKEPIPGTRQAHSTYHDDEQKIFYVPEANTLVAFAGHSRFIFGLGQKEMTMQDILNQCEFSPGTTYVDVATALWKILCRRDYNNPINIFVLGQDKTAAGIAPAYIVMDYIPGENNTRGHWVLRNDTLYAGTRFLASADWAKQLFAQIRLATDTNENAARQALELIPAIAAFSQYTSEPAIGGAVQLAALRTDGTIVFPYTIA